MNSRQIEELARLYLDIGKITFTSLVFGFFQAKSDPRIVFAVGLLGLTFSITLFILGLKLLKGSK